MAGLPRPEGAAREDGFGFEAPGVAAEALTVPLPPDDVLAFYERELPGAGYCPDARAATPRGGTLVARGPEGTVTVIVKQREGGGASLVVSHMAPPAALASPTAPPADPPRDAS